MNERDLVLPKGIIDKMSLEELSVHLTKVNNQISFFANKVIVLGSLKNDLEERMRKLSDDTLKDKLLYLVENGLEDLSHEVNLFSQRNNAKLEFSGYKTTFKDKVMLYFSYQSLDGDIHAITVFLAEDTVPILSYRLETNKKNGKTYVVLKELGRVLTKEIIPSVLSEI
jgi:hypothetical protein